MKILPDGRTLLLSRPLVIGGAAELLTDDGRRDGALDPTRPLDLMQLPHGTYSQWTVGSSVITDASMSGSKLIMIGQEFDQFGFGLLHQAAVVLRTDSIVPSAPMSGTAFVTTSGYQPVVPERVLDTRPDSQVGYSGPKPAAGSVVEVTVTGAGQPALPANATAVVLNVTGTGATADGFVTVWPCGFQRPLAANLNLVANGTRPNLVVVKIGAGGKVCLYTQTGTHLVADVNGWYRASSSFVPVVPERLLDTRPATQIGYHGASPAAGTTVQLQVTGVGISNIPANAAAIVLNVTATNVSTDGFVTVWPCGTQRPDTASVTTQRGLTAPNLVISLLGNGGTLCLNTLTAADLIADVSGYFTAGGEFTPVQPGRTLDTRSGFRYTGPAPGPGQTVEFAPGLPLLSPSFDEATAVVLNITGVAPGADGFVTVWPCGTPRPLAANLNLSSGSITPNLVIVSLRASGTVCIYTQSGADFVADMFGYFT
jgi:hypothetical protein